MHATVCRKEFWKWMVHENKNVVFRDGDNFCITQVIQQQSIAKTYPRPEKAFSYCKTKRYIISTKNPVKSFISHAEKCILWSFHDDHFVIWREKFVSTLSGHTDFFPALAVIEYW